MDKYFNKQTVLGIIIVIIFFIVDNYPHQEVRVSQHHGYPFYGHITAITPKDGLFSDWLSVELVMYSVTSDMLYVCRSRHEVIYFNSFCTYFRSETMCSIHSSRHSMRLPGLAVCVSRKIKGGE